MPASQWWHDRGLRSYPGRSRSRVLARGCVQYTTTTTNRSTRALAALACAVIFGDPPVSSRLALAGVGALQKRDAQLCDVRAREPRSSRSPSSLRTPRIRCASATAPHHQTPSASPTPLLRHRHPKIGLGYTPMAYAHSTRVPPERPGAVRRAAKRDDSLRSAEPEVDPGFVEKSTMYVYEHSRTTGDV
ncbi:hypothetical protein FB107DRAFT_279044 [Schizophyllum commune]